jgi:hypothetical protein
VWSASEREEACWRPSVYAVVKGLAHVARGMADEVTKDMWRVGVAQREQVKARKEVFFSSEHGPLQKCQCQ